MMRKAEAVVPAFEEVDSVDARVAPTGTLENLSQDEVDRLLDTSRGGLYPLYRRCSLAVLNSGGETDDARAIFERYADFDISIVRQAWGVKLQLRNAPATAFVDGRMIRGIQEHLFAVLRDILYLYGEVLEHGAIVLKEPEQITNAAASSCASRRASPTPSTACSATQGSCRRACAPTWSCAGAGTRSAARNTSTRRRSATSWGSAPSTSALAAAPAR